LYFGLLPVRCWQEVAQGFLIWSGVDDFGVKAGFARYNLFIPEVFADAVVEYIAGYGGEVLAVIGKIIDVKQGDTIADQGAERR